MALLVAKLRLAVFGYIDKFNLVLMTIVDTPCIPWAISVGVQTVGERNSILSDKQRRWLYWE